MIEARAPRQLIHRGVVAAAAVLVDPALTGPREAARRVVRAWAPGASVHRLAGALLVTWPAPRMMAAQRAPGLLLTRADDRPEAPLISAPLAQGEIDAAAPPPGSVLLVRAGEVRALCPAERDRVDPATLLDVGAFALAQVTSLGEAPTAPTVVHAPLMASTRAVLGVGAPPAEAATILAALLRMRDATSSERAAGAAAPGSATLSWLSSLLSGLAGLLGRLFAGRSSGASRSLPAAARPRRSLAAYAVDPPGPSLGERLSAFLRTLAARLMVRARLAHFIGRKQAEYMEKLLAMLDGADLGAALRHAIPLGKGGLEGPSAPMLGVPSPRTDLAIPLGPRGLGAIMFGSFDLYELLRNKYRAMFDRLVAAGRIDEAAFVLAELLREEAEAVSFLERHGRLRLAAEIAEARGLPPALQVRQWFLAGDRARAIAIARRHRAFADALARMKDDEGAAELRALWAELLAEAGDFAAAVEVIWPIAGARALGARWIDRAIAQGGAGAARMLVKKLALVPSAFPEVRDLALALLREEGPSAAVDRRALGDALAAAPATPETRLLCRAAARALAKDGGVGGDAPTQQIVKRLVTASGDAALRVDMPAWPTVDRPPLQQIAAARRIEIAASDTGVTPVLEAAHLPNGSTLLALGEAGVRVIARSGKPLFSLDEPAHELVISDHGDRALALAPRGPSVFRVARLDLAGRRSEPWSEVELACFARTFDGDSWIVALDTSFNTLELHRIDALDTRFAALDTTPLDAGPSAIGRGPSSASVAAMRVSGPELRLDWARLRYELPGFTLRTRRPVLQAVAVNEVLHTAASAALVAVLRLTGERTAELIVARESGEERVTLTAEVALGRERASLAADDGWVACSLVEAWGTRVLLLDAPRLCVRAEVRLSGAGRASLAFCGGALTIADDRGRVLVIELAHGALIHDLRV